MECKKCREESGESKFCKTCEKEYDECKCGAYKKKKYPICLFCQGTSEKLGLSKKSSGENRIKGKLAEAIVENMFLDMDYRVFRFGMEHTVPGFTKNKPTGETAEHVKKMPDFIIIKNSQTDFIEVKFRKNGEFDFKKEYDNRGGYPFKYTHFILITKKHILVQRADELEKGKKFTYLGRYTHLDTNREIILEYCKFCEKFFGNC
jgi:hypothetical protein